MTTTTRRAVTRRTMATAGVVGLAGALAKPALAQSGKLRWRMVTSWPKRLPGPGMSAERVAEREQAHRGQHQTDAGEAGGTIVERRGDFGE